MSNDITALMQKIKAAAITVARDGRTDDEWFYYLQCVHHKNVLALVEALEKAQAINAAAEKLVRCKGRYHSEQNYRALAALFGVKTPDLPPLESESRTVTVKLPEYRNSPDMHTKQYYEVIGFNQGLDACVEALAAAGINVEAE